MALLPSISSLFGSRTPAQVNPAAPAVAASQVASASGNPTTPSPATPQSNGSVAAIPPAGQGDQSPLANFAELWKTDPNTPATKPDTLTPVFNLDPKGLHEAASRVDFTAHIPAETFQKALTGDVAALRDAINKAAQFGFANASAASATLVKESLGSAEGILRDRILPSTFRDQQVSAALQESNPIFTDPAVAPMMTMLKQQFMSKYPTASPQEIATQAAAYLSAMSGKIVTASGGQVVSKEQQAVSRGGFAPAQEQDWSKFFGFPDA